MARGGLEPTGLTGFAVASLSSFILINIFLALFNLLPLPPFDGSHIVEGLLPPRAARVYDKLRPFGFPLLFLLLLVIHQRRMIGGGDVKLLVALALGLPLVGVIQLLTITAFAGGVLALVHLMMRNLPSPRLAPAGSSVLRRVYAVERWRHVRHAPLPYGVAIAFGGIWAIFSKGI